MTFLESNVGMAQTQAGTPLSAGTRPGAGTQAALAVWIGLTLLVAICLVGAVRLLGRDGWLETGSASGVAVEPVSAAPRAAVQTISQSAGALSVPAGPAVVAPAEQAVAAVAASEPVSQASTVLEPLRAEQPAEEPAMEVGPEPGPAVTPPAAQ